MNQILKKDIKNINKEIRKDKLKIIRGLERENGKNCYMLDNYCENLESCLKMSGTKTCKLLQNKIDSSFLKYKFYLFSKIQFRSGNLSPPLPHAKLTPAGSVTGPTIGCRLEKRRGERVLSWLVRCLCQSCVQGGLWPGLSLSSSPSVPLWERSAVW